MPFCRSECKIHWDREKDGISLWPSEEGCHLARNLRGLLRCNRILTTTVPPET